MIHGSISIRVTEQNNNLNIVFETNFKVKIMHM